MNIMRKIWVSGTGSSGGGSGGNGQFPGSSSSGSTPHSISLGLMHLRKLFGDYLHSPSDDKIYNMLPLFCKVFGASSSTDIMERFPEINSFCQAVSKLMVTEVRKRATNQSTEAAAISIIRFFEAATANEEDSHGWTLLSTLNLLAAGDESLILILTAASVPSTLVKCLYLFFDLPEIQPPDRKGPTSDFSPMERRLLLQKIFVQLLIRLSSHPSPAEELAKRDDLALLFSAVTSWCPPQNAMWRKSSSEVLMTISTQIIHSPPVLSYIHNKGCIGLCVENLRRGSHLTPLEITEMVLTLFCFLKDSSDLSQVLLDDFKSAQGYQFFVEILLKLEADLSSESQEAIRNLVLVVSSLTMCGFTVLKPNMANVESLFSLPTFQLPPAGAKGFTVRNLQAFQVLQSVFTKSTTPFLSGVILDAISSIFKAEHSNYFIADSILPQMAEKLIAKNSEVHSKFLEIVEFIVFQLQFTPCKELIAISRILKNDLSEVNCTTANQEEGSSSSRAGRSNRNSLIVINVTQGDIENETRLKLLCVKMLLNLAKHNALFKDVFREIGILEALITCLHRFGSDTQDVNHRDIPDSETKDEVGLVVIELLTLILTGTTANVSIFRENSGSKCALQLATNPSTRGAALGLIQQLLMSQGGEEDMSSALVALHSSDMSTSLGFKIDILTALLTCFRESHRARCNFRKAGGFLYLMSVLVSMEGLLLQQNVSSAVIRERMHMVQLIFTTFALSMRFEPANAKLFHQEICLPSLADTLRLLGCFSREFKELSPKFPPSVSIADSTSLVTEENVQLFHSIFTTLPTNLDPQSYQGKIPFTLVLCVFLFRLLFDLAIDAFERNFPPSGSTTTPAFRSSPRKQISGDIDGVTSSSSGIPSEPCSPIPGGPGGKKLSVGSLNLTPPQPEPVLIHSAVVIVMVKLIPSIWQSIGQGQGAEDGNTTSVIASCQLYCAELVKSLVRSEKNQQLMAQVGLVDEILERCAVALSDESHYLHSPIHYAFERVATHSLSPKDFRRFFRLGNPLNCDRLAPQSANISILYSLPVSRVKSLVSMTMSKSVGSHGGGSQSQSSSHQSNAGPAAPFVEFDMSAEGFGALFLPSLAPHNIPSGSEFGSSGLLATGIGMGERVFPGVTGMSFSTWFSVDKFSDPRTDPHPIRLLTIIKETGTGQRLSLCIIVSARDKAMIVSTRESPLPAQGIGEWEPEGSLSGSVRVWCPELLHEGQWHHLFFAFSTSSSHSFTVYVNGRPTSTGKLEYPHRTKGASYSAFIGTPPAWRKTSRLTWRQGVAHFFEDWVPGAQSVQSIYKLGPEYPGSWQAVKIQSETAGTLIAEDKIIFGLNALAVSQLTLAKIRKIYSKTDAKAIAKQLGLSSHENATPISILHNSAAHLIGPARTLGGVTIGYIGVRVYAPLPVSKSILSIGGIQVLIGLVAMANTGEMLYASLKAFVCVVKSNTNTNLVSETSWQTLGYLLKRKKHLLTMRVLHLVFGLVSSDSSGGVSNLSRENRSGFVELLGDIDIWCPFPVTSGNSKSSLGVFDSGASTPDTGIRKQPSSEEPTPSSTFQHGLATQNLQKFDFLQANVDLEKALYEHFLQLLNDDPKNSLDVLREANIVPKLLRRLIMSSSSINQGPIFLLLSHLLAHKGNASAVDLITFGHFIAGTLPQLNKREPLLTDGIELRNKALQLIHSLMYTGKVLNVGFCDELVHRLGFDFVLLFATSNLHPSTLLWAIRILLLLITSSPTLKNKFRDGSHTAWCFAKTATAAQQCGGSLRNSYAMLPLKRQETRDGEDTSAGGTPVSGGPVSVIAGGLTGKSGKGYTGGWARLSWLLAQRCDDIRTEGTDVFPSEIWLILCAMVLSQPCRNVSLKMCGSDQLTLDAIWNYVFALPANRMTSSLYGKVILCPDAIITLLTLIRCFITAESGVMQDKNIPGMGGASIGNPSHNLQPHSHSPGSSPSAFHSDIASCLVQFLCYLYSHTPEFQTIFTSTEILSALAASVMPIEAGIGALVIDNVATADGGIDVEEAKVFPSDNEPLELGLEVLETSNDSPDGEFSGYLNSYKKSGKKSPPAVSMPQGASENLMNHSAKKIILDFLRMLIIDWMSSSSSQSQSKTGVAMNIVIDTVLEAGNVETDVLGNNGLFPSKRQYSAALLTQFHTNLLGTLLDHLIAFDLDRMTGYLQAVAHFLSRLVDKLWLESFARDPQVVFDFILILVSHCKTKRVPPTTTDMIYNSLNRVVLFILSRRSNEWDKVEALKKIRGVRSVIFGSGNHQQDFFGCLVYVLMQLVDGLPISLESGNKTQWHVRVTVSEDEGSVDSSNGKSRTRVASATLDNEISKTAEKVWEDLFISKKPMVEDVFKITFPSPQPPSLFSLRDEIGDSANKLWLTYVASETTPGIKKSTNPASMSQSWEIHQQLQSKLQKVTGGLTRLAGRSGIRKESEKEKTIKDVVSQWNESKRCQVGSNKNLLIVKDALEVHERCHQENMKHLNRFVRDTLLPQLEHELTRERGLWGPTQPSHLDKWMLDTTEGPCRMRKKLMRNEMFYTHYPYSEQLIPPGSTGNAVSSPKARRINPPISRDAKEFHKKFKHQPSFINDMCIGSVDDIEESSGSVGQSGSSSSDPNFSPKTTGMASVDDPFSEASIDSTADPDNQSMLFRLIGTANEKISQLFRVAQIQGLDTAEGLLLFGKDHFYLISGFTILAKSREIKDMYYLPANMYEPILPPQDQNGPPSRPRDFDPTIYMRRTNQKYDGINYYYTCNHQRCLALPTAELPFASYKTIRKHVIQHHGTDKMRDEWKSKALAQQQATTTSQRNSGQDFPCLKCSMVFKSAKDLNSHTTRIHGSNKNDLNYLDQKALANPEDGMEWNSQENSASQEKKKVLEYAGGLQSTSLKEPQEKPHYAYWTVSFKGKIPPGVTLKSHLRVTSPILWNVGIMRSGKSKSCSDHHFNPGKDRKGVTELGKLIHDPAYSTYAVKKTKFHGNGNSEANQLAAKACEAFYFCYGSGPSPAKPRSKTHSCWKFSYDDMKEVHKRRYLLQPIALEIFCSDGINYLLAFPRKVRNVVFQKFTSVSKNLSDGTDAKQSVAGQRRSTSVEQSTGIFSSLIGDTTVTQRWVKGEISNFQYLMYMNTLAGRSYNDLMQYPVFPWILADYDSPFLDLNDPETFRDLSKPMGAQTNSRLVQFVKRFKEWDDPHGETPPYHYGTHYSSAMIVCSYLVRMEPFAQHFLKLQGGHFDLADRMFHSIKEAWTSSSMHNMADVKELIPEFFYLPEFLQNSNNFDLGFKQNGIALGDVLLPPWAKNDAKEFIRVHREALESDYVSQHLHEWIDLVFGFKQQGQPAVDAVNVFHHLFYEGNVDIYTIDDPLKKNATIGFINNFGQIPKQLFKKPHPMKRLNSSGGSLTSGLGLMKQYNILEAQNPLLALAATAGSAVSSQLSSSSGEKLFYHHVDHLRPTLAPIKELKGPVGQIMPLDRPNVIIAVEQNKFLMSPMKYISWGFADSSVRISNVDTDRPQFIWEQCQQQLWMGSTGEVVTCTSASEKIAITGSTNTVISVWEFVDKEFRLKSHLYGHSEAITCLTCSPSYNIIVSGSKDLTCIVWDLARLSFVRQLVSHVAPIDAVGVNELNGDIATCDGSWLRLWSINGDLIGQIDTAGIGGGGGMSQGILCVAFSYLNEWEQNNVIITGSTDGIVRLWSVSYAQVPEEDIGGNVEPEGILLVNQSLTDDSSMITGSDSDEQPEGELNDMNHSEDDSTQDRDTEVLSVAEVFDPDKDRDSCEDLRDEASTRKSFEESVGKETQLEKVKSSARRQRALSSGTSSTRHESTSGGSGTAKLRSNSSLNTAEKQAKRKSDIPKQGSSTSVCVSGENEEKKDKETIRPSIRSSKSENSLSIDIEESFDILSEAEVAALRKEERDRKMSYGSALRAANALKEGHVWQRRLVFRGKLTMHTAYDRQDNKEPASITAIAVGRDHRNIYVGDARGRVFSWTCSDTVSGRADHWQRDEVADSCGTCKTKFSITERKHHCRSCGCVFCSKCSRFESEIFRLRILRPVRVCQPCFVQLKGDVRSNKQSTSSDV